MKEFSIVKIDGVSRPRKRVVWIGFEPGHFGPFILQIGFGYGSGSFGFRVTTVV